MVPRVGGSGKERAATADRVGKACSAAPSSVVVGYGR